MIGKVGPFAGQENWEACLRCECIERGLIGEVTDKSGSPWKPCLFQKVNRVKCSQKCSSKGYEMPPDLVKVGLLVT